MTISDTLQQPAGTIIDHVFGVLVEVGPYERKNRPDGEEYTAQSFMLSDQTHELRGTVYDHYPLDDKMNQTIYFCSMKSRNGRFGGVTTAKQEQGSLFSRKPSITTLRVSKAGSIHNQDTFKGLKRK